MARPVGCRSVDHRVQARSDLPSMFVGAGDGLEASQEFVAADELEQDYVARELKVLLSTGTEFAQDQVVRLHAPARVLSDSHRNGTRRPIGRGERRCAKAYALGVVTVFDVEVAGLAQDEGDAIGELFVIAGRDDVDVRITCCS